MSGAALWAWAVAAPALDARRARLAQAVPAGVSWARGRCDKLRAPPARP